MPRQEPPEFCLLPRVPSEFPDSSVGKESACNARESSLIPQWGRSAGEGIGYPFQYSWAFLVAQLVKNLPALWETWVWSLGWEDPWRRERLPTPVFWPGEYFFQGFPDSSVGKESPCNAEDPGSIPGLGISAEEGIGYLLQYSWASLWLSW